MDYYRGVRTGVVLIWMITNFALAAVVLSTGGLDKFGPQDKEGQEEGREERSNIYMAVVLWSVAGLSAFKFLGALWFLIVEDVGVVSFTVAACARQFQFWRYTPFCFVTASKVNGKGRLWRKWKIVPRVPRYTVQEASCVGFLLYVVPANCLGCLGLVF